MSAFANCRNCQKAMGSPFFARALFDQRSLIIEGDTARYPSSEAFDRVFRLRDAPVFPTDQRYRDRRRARRLRRPQRLRADRTIWVSEKMAWVRLDDGLPQYQETVPQ
jgi:hypothetical protein